METQEENSIRISFHLHLIYQNLLILQGKNSKKLKFMGRKRKRNYKNQNHVLQNGKEGKASTQLYVNKLQLLSGSKHIIVVNGENRNLPHQEENNGLVLYTHSLFVYLNI